MIKKVLLIIIISLFCLISLFGYQWVNNNNNKYEISTSDLKNYVSKFYSVKDIFNSFIVDIQSKTKDTFDNLRDYANFNFTWDNDLKIKDNILSFLLNIGKILFTPIKFIISMVLLIFNYISLFIYYIGLFITWAISFGEVLWLRL